jgi:hypothetical protein
MPSKGTVALSAMLGRWKLGGRWNTFTVGSGALEPTGSTLRFVTTDTSSRQVTDAQVDDYQGLPRRRYLWQPPLTLTVRARFSHAAPGEQGHPHLRGTAGFGFWSDPFLMTGGYWPALPRAIWFFYASPPSNIKLDLAVPGYGWKAATIDATRRSALYLAPVAPIAIPLMNLHPVYRKLWPHVQQSLGVREALVPADMVDWHTYTLEWGRQSAHFGVDGEPVLDCDVSPRGPLGFVIWLDNQYLVATPWGRFRYGLLSTPGQQWMEVETLSIQPHA